MNLTPRKKNSKSRNKDKSKDKFVDKEIEEKVRQETEKKNINTDEQDKARLEAEIRSKEITKEAEDKAQSIILEAEDKAQSIILEAEDKAQSIILEAEDKARSESIEKKMTNQEITKIMDYYHQEEEKVPIKLKENSYHENYNSSNLFMPGFSLWQDYAKIWMEFSKETANNTTKKVFRYFENTNEKN
jgi:hypothetical protein